MPYTLRLLFTALLLSPLYAEKSALEWACNKVAASQDVKHGSIGLAVVDTADSEILYLYNGHKSLKPASSLKAITTATVLSLLGSDFTFQTVLSADGDLSDDGLLDGNLIIKGGGDPTLGYQRWKDLRSYKGILKIWHEVVREAGIREVLGAVIGDDTAYESGIVSRKWIWEDMGNYYGAGASGLNLHENQYTVQFTSGKSAGAPTSITQIYPKPKSLEITNEVKAGAPGSGDQAYIFSAPYSNHAFIRGTIPPARTGFSIRGSIPNPALFTAESLDSTLEENGIKCQSPAQMVRTMKPKKSDTINVLHRHKSPPLIDLIHYANKHSINLYCEAFIKEIAHQKIGKGTTAGGLRELKMHWKGKGVDLHGAFLQDGSGLSPENSITPVQMALILSKIEDEPWFPDYKKSLTARAGTYSKSGTIGRVKAYAGYVTTTEGKLLSFSLMLNNYTCSNGQAQDKLLSLMSQLSHIKRDPPAQTESK